MSRPRLVIAKGEGKGKIFELEQGNNLIGRWDPDTGAFPEIDLDKTTLRGLNITIVTSANTDAEGEALLEEFGMPFKKSNKSEAAAA